MADAWSLDVTLSGRDVLHRALAAGGRARTPGPCSLTVVLCGGARAAGRALGPGDLVATPDAEILADGGGCRLGALRWEGAGPAGPVSVDATPARRFAKYQSWQSQLAVRDGARDLLAPWELYRVGMVGCAAAGVQLHVHRRVTNLLFVPGRAGEPRGWLLVERAGRVTATPLRGGDRAVVPPGLVHHVIPVAEETPTEMLVLNDEPSAYEDAERADFHHVRTVAWQHVLVGPSPDREPCLTALAGA